MASDSGTVTIAAVGDVSLGDHPMCVGRGVAARLAKTGSGRPLYPFEHSAPLFAGADLVFGNLETPLGNDGLRPRDIRSLEMRGPADGAMRLKRAGFAAVNIANNHILQHGAGAFGATVAALNQQDVGVVGLRQPHEPATVPLILERRGLRVALLGFAFEPDKYFEGTPLYAFGPDCDIAGEVARARAQADVVVCSMHWGEEFIRYPNSRMRSLGRTAIDAGAHLVLGHHPHVFQGIETYRHGAIAYSLGNFAFDMLWDPALKTGLVLRIAVAPSGVSDIDARFVSMSEEFQPVPLDENAAAAWRDELARLSSLLADPPSDEQYEREYAELVSRNRRQSYGYVLRHGAEYAPSMLATILARPIVSRLKRR